MSHNIKPAASGMVTSMVIHTRGGRDIGFIFQDSELGIAKTGFPNEFNEMPLIIDGPRTGWIGGEDLFALRELLLEMPEEAFVRPADPVVESWCFFDGSGDLWVFIDGGWTCVLDDIWLDRCHSAFGGFDSHEEVIRLNGVQAPRWVDGDRIVRLNSAGMTVLYTRHKGAWNRSLIGASSQPTTAFDDSDDAMIDDMLAEDDSYTVLRKGGKNL